MGRFRLMVVSYGSRNDLEITFLEYLGLQIRVSLLA